MSDGMTKFCKFGLYDPQTGSFYCMDGEDLGVGPIAETTLLFATEREASEFGIEGAVVTRVWLSANPEIGGIL